MSQANLFAVDIAREIVNPFPTADLKVVAVGRDGFEYACKRQVDHQDLPASEWLGYHIGQRLQIALPPFALLTDGHALHFGSRFEGGTQQWSDVAPADQPALLQSGQSDMSRILALDLFLGNDDRHLNNFLFRPQKVGGALTVMAMDFSRSLLVRGWPNDTIPMPTEAKTMMVLSLLRHLKLWDQGAAQLLLMSLQTITAAEFGHWLGSMPAAWLDASRQAALLAWWSSPALGQRIAACTMLV